MSGHSHSMPQLTRNQSLVFETLSKADAPLTAYNILDQLKGEGLRAPLQVYRALDKLLETGLAHRLETINAFVACSDPGCETHETVAFMICDNCGQTVEMSDPDLAERLRVLSAESGFRARKTTIEIRGACRACAAA